MPSVATASCGAPPPPGPASEIDLVDIRRDPIGLLEDLVGAYGPIVRHVVDGRAVTTVNSPAMVQHVLGTNRANYTKTGTPDEQMLVPLLGRGLLTSDGDEWRRQRQLAQPVFAHRHLVSFDGLMAGAGDRLAASWCEQAGRTIRVDHDLTSLTLTVVAQALLGSDLAVGDRFGVAVDAANRFMGHYGGDDSAGDRAAFVHAVRFLDRIVHLLIASARLDGTVHVDGTVPIDGTARTDLLAHLLRARTDERPGGFSGRELRDQVLTMLMAGHETTAKGLTWVLYLLDRHPQVRGQLEREISDALAGAAPTAADVAALPTCRHVVLEALRLYPPVWLISRNAVADDVVAGHHVPAGSLVCISPWLLHRRTEDWGDDVDAFRPDRFADRPDGRDPAAGRGSGAPSWSYLPFSAGARQCIGQQFALLESTLVLASIVARVRLHLVPGHPVEPEALVTLRPRYGMLMTAEPRPPRSR